MEKEFKNKVEWNAPNILTVGRILAVPIILTLLLVNHYSTNTDIQLIVLITSGILFIIASFTDWLDGYLARKKNQVSQFGKLLDPIADKLLVNMVLIMFAVDGFLPVWITVILILRDTIVDFIRMSLSGKGVTLAAGIYGKLKTTFQMIGLILLFFFNHVMFESLGNKVWIEQIILIPMYVATIFSIYSGALYVKGAIPILFK